MEAKAIFNKMKIVQEHLLNFFDEENDTICFTDLINKIDKINIKSQYEIKEFLYIISKISDNHTRKFNLISKIEQLLLHFKEEIKQNFTNASIFNIFKKNKRILLFLFEEQLIKIDENILSVFSKPKYIAKNYYEYFLPEILSYHKKKPIEADETSMKIFNQKRKIGENDDYICTLIQKDSVIEFISYVNKTNYPLSSNIKTSIFETNRFLLKSQQYNLIEYAAFFGSMQIIKYLFMNKVKLTSYIWFCAIHGRNPELIHFLEENGIKSDDSTFENCYIESILCFHIDLSNYISEKNPDESQYYDTFTQLFKCHNYFFLSENDLHPIVLMYAIYYDFIYMVKFLSKDKNMNETLKISLFITFNNVLN